MPDLSSTISFVTAFLASLVEAVEALTVVLAVGLTQSWRSSLAGTGFALFFLVVVTLVVGPALEWVPIHILQLGIGFVTCLFGFGWLKKAILREAGRIPKRQEDLKFQEQVHALKGNNPNPQSGNLLGALTTFKATLLEGIEVIFIVLTVGSANHAPKSAAIGASAALALVTLAGLLLHRPLARVPENLLKYSVGILLTALGTLWVTEALGIHWPGGESFILALALLYLLLSLLATHLLRTTPPSTLPVKPAP